MFTLLLVLASIFGYAAVGATVTRVNYIREYKRYLSWKNEGGSYQHFYKGEGYSYRPPQTRKRTEATYGSYRESISTYAPPGLTGTFWFLYLPAVAVDKFIHPEVKAPDYHKIDELESL